MNPHQQYNMALQTVTECGNFTLNFKQLDFCVSPLFLQTLRSSFQMKDKICFYLKKKGLWTTGQHTSTFSLYPSTNTSNIILGSRVACRMESSSCSPCHADVCTWWFLMLCHSCLAIFLRLRSYLCTFSSHIPFLLTLC